MSESEKQQEEIAILKRKLLKSEEDLKKALEQVGSFKKKYERVVSYNEELESQLKKLSQEVQRYRSKEGNIVTSQGQARDLNIGTGSVTVKTEPVDTDEATTNPTNFVSPAMDGVVVKTEPDQEATSSQRNIRDLGNAPVVIKTEPVDEMTTNQNVQDLGTAPVVIKTEPVDEVTTNPTNTGYQGIGAAVVKTEPVEVTTNPEPSTHQNDSVTVSGGTTQNKDVPVAEPMSIAESLKAAAEEVVQQSGYVYDEISGMYYDYNTGYYYDNEKSLYYDPASGTYFYYDHATSEYKFHSQVKTLTSTLHNYNDLDAPNSGDKQCTWNPRDREKNSSNSRKHRCEKVGDKEERNGMEHGHRHKHKKKKSHKRDGRKDKHKKRKKDKDEHDVRKKKKKRKREKDDDEEKSTSRKKRKRDKPERRRDKRAKEFEDEDTKGIRKENELKEGLDSVKVEERVKGIDEQTLDNGEKVEACIYKEIKKDNLDYKDCDIFEDVSQKKSDVKTEVIADDDKKSSDTESVEMRDAAVRVNAADSPGCVETDLIEISSDESDLEEGEISDISTTSSSSSTYSSSDEDSELESEPDSPMSVETRVVVEEENSKAYPPCIRAMVKESDCLDRGSLYLVTYMGATIGREKNLGHTIVIDDLLVSKMHAELKYSEDFKRYTVIDHASQNGTFVNGLRVCEPKVMGDPRPLFHGNELQIGGTTLELHIHPGTDTCDDCEPGLVQAQIQQEPKPGAAVAADDSNSLSTEEKRRRKLKQIKKRFGLENMTYSDDMSAINNPKYQDKATERRKTKGSDNPYLRDEAPASVERAIPKENKGRKLLQKMGWSEGDSLGKSGKKGLKEPIKVNIRSTPQAGLGSALNIQTSLDNVHSVKKRELWSKMQQRYTATMSEAEPKDPDPKQDGWVSGGVVMDNSMEVVGAEQAGEPSTESGDINNGAKNVLVMETNS